MVRDVPAWSGAYGSRAIYDHRHGSKLEHCPSFGLSTCIGLHRIEATASEDAA